MTLLLDLERPETWPRDLLSYLDAHHDLFLGWELQGEGRASRQVSAQAFDRAIYGLLDVMDPYYLTGMHCTRLTQDEIAAIIREGMGLPNLDMLKRRIDAVEAEGLFTPAVAQRLRAKNQAHEPNREMRIWFCFFPPHIGDESGIGCFFRYWGGEALYNSHDADPETGPRIAAIGVPCLIEADVPIAAMRQRTSLAFKIVTRFLVTRGYQTREPLDHEDATVQPLPATAIRRIIRFPEPEFIAHTKCDLWRNSLAQPKLSFEKLVHQCPLPRFERLR